MGATQWIKSRVQAWVDSKLDPGFRAKLKALPTRQNEYGYDPFGWYGDYYYPGVGIYVYDRHHSRHVWNDTQRRYWENRRSHWRDHSGSTGASVTTQNWSGFDRSGWRNRSSNTTDGTRNWNRSSNWQSRSSETTSGERSSEHGWRHRDHD